MIETQCTEQDRTEDGPSLLDMLATAQLDLRAADFYRLRARTKAALFDRYADAYTAHHADWLTNGSEEARFVRGVEELRGKIAAPPEEPPKTLTAREAATRLRLVKPDGTPRDSFYSNVAPRTGQRAGTTWLIDADKLETFARGEL